MNATHSNDKPGIFIPSTTVNPIVFDNSKLNEDTLTKIGIKSCSIMLHQLVLSKIEMKYSVISSPSKEDAKLFWDLKQQNSNNFTIQIKRKVVHDDCDREMTSQKKVKFNETTTVQPNDFIVESTLT